MPLSIALTYTKFTPTKASFKYSAALLFFLQTQRSFFPILSFRKQHFVKDLSKVWDLVSAISKLSCSFLMPTYKQAKWYNYTPVKPRALSSVFRGWWEASCLTAVRVAPCPWSFWGFLHRLLSQLQSTICSLGFCSLLHFLSQWKVLHVLFWCGQPPSAWLLLYMELLNTFFFWVWSSIFVYFKTCI